MRTAREGGTGSVSEQPTQPQFLPDKYEPGSHNAMGIVGLSAAVQWVTERTVESLHAHDTDLVRTFIDGVQGIDGLTRSVSLPKPLRSSVQPSSRATRICRSRPRR